MDPERWQRLERLFHEALAQVPEKRHHFLAEACPDDEALRKKVRALLESPASTWSLLDTSAGTGTDGEAGDGPDLTGRRIGSYHVLSLIGSGGMGEIYRAQDTTLGREVALKAVPRAFADNPERVARLRREARTLASLNHPHIATLYGYETDGATGFLVMELVSGETLEARLRRGPLSLAEALRTGMQIAAALDCAHRHGVVHRDLKPANVMLTREGVKVLDFGLARPFGPASDIEASTITAPLTHPGAVLGTLPYMAPEQLQGKEADARTDVFALGTLLHEMVTGRRPFEESSSLGLIAAILTGARTPMQQLGPHVPSAFTWVVERCLALDPDQRWHSAHDVGLELQRIGEVDTKGEAEAGPVALRQSRVGWVAAVALAIALAVVTLFRDRTNEPIATPLPALQRVPIDPGLPVVDQAVLSPDGQTLAYLAGDSQYDFEVYVRPLSSLQSTRLEGTHGAEILDFSPDGTSLAFIARANPRATVNLFTVPLSGGRPEPIVEGVLPWSVSWERDQFIYYTDDDRLWRAPARGGVPELLDVGPAGGDAQYDARLLPDARHWLFGTLVWNKRHPDNRDVVLVDGNGGNARPLSIRGVNPRFVASRFLLFSLGPMIYATTLDPDNRWQIGTPSRAIEFDVQRSPRYVQEIAPFSVSGSGDLAFVRSQNADAKELIWIDSDGRVQPVAEDRRDYSLPRISPNGSTLAVSVTEAPGRQSLWMLDLETRAWQKVEEPVTDQTSSPTCVPCSWSTGVWTSDSKYFTFPSNRDGPVNLYHQAADFASAADRLVPSRGTQTPWDWSPDGRYLLYSDSTKPGLWIYDHETGSAIPPNDDEPFVRGARFHPSGRWVTYSTHPIEYRSMEPTFIWVRPFPGPGVPRQIGAERGYGPEWSADGDALYFRGDTQVMEVAVEQRGGQLVTGQAMPLFEDVYVRHAVAGIGGFDIHPDGRFLMVREHQGTSGPRIVIVQNLRTRLEELFPK